MTQKVDRQYIEEVLEFVIKSKFFKADRETIKDIIAKHLCYNTLLVIRDKGNGEILAVGRFNFIGPNTIHVLDCLIKKGLRSVKMLKYMLLSAVRSRPEIKYFIYDRLTKYPYRSQRGYAVREWLKG